MTKNCLIKIIKNSLNLCNSSAQEKRIYGKIYNFCKENLELQESDFYSKLKITTFNPYKRDMIHSSNPEATKKGKILYNILSDGLMDVFSLNIYNNIEHDKLSEIRSREIKLIKDFYSKNG